VSLSLPVFEDKAELVWKLFKNCPLLTALAVVDILKALVYTLNKMLQSVIVVYKNLNYTFGFTVQNFLLLLLTEKHLHAPVLSSRTALKMYNDCAAYKD
jgi:hypothetical protein